MTKGLEELKIKIFSDGADLQEMIEMSEKPLIKGLTTNPTLMRKAGVPNYKTFAKQALKQIRVKPISFEVFSDDLEEMKKQALEIASWGDNVFVKIPITNTKGESTVPVITFLTSREVKVNITAIMTLNQVKKIVPAINPSVPNFISIFAGRIADTGVDPQEIVTDTVKILSDFNQKSEIIWASPRELLNIYQADAIGCHVITATKEILQKSELVGKNLESYSLETVKMFRKDALESDFKI
jgi:transaldolase